MKKQNVFTPKLLYSSIPSEPYHLKKAVTPIKIYQLHFDNEHYDYFVPEQDLPISELRTFDGRSKKNEWTPLAVRRANWRKGMELSDAPCCILPVCSR